MKVRPRTENLSLMKVRPRTENLSFMKVRPRTENPTYLSCEAVNPVRRAAVKLDKLVLK